MSDADTTANTTADPAANTNTNIDTDTDLLNEANACHDADVPRGAALLRRIAPAALPTDKLPTYAFLLNHVLGEKLGAWPEALQRQQQLWTLPSPPSVLWRQTGAAASAAGDEAVLHRAVAAYAEANAVPVAQAFDIIALSAAMYLTPASGALEAARLTMAAIAPFAEAAWGEACPVDAAAATCLNNIASGLQDRPLTDLRVPELRAALQASAELAYRFWLRAGTWVNAERALYLLAMVGNALGDGAAARAHALAALALLDAHDTEHAEDVDRAFVELERAQACRALGLIDEAAVAAAQSNTLATAFGDAGLTAWFDSRRARLALLPA